jgi:phage tail sheath protein FI
LNSIRAIAGVPTSVTAFVGATKLGPVNRPAHCFSFDDYESGFGGLAAASEVSYAVRQFFANGGRDAIVVRIGKGRRPLKKRLVDAIHALDGEDLFSVLCLPGVSDPAVHADAVAYCRTRRAFFIADVPAAIVTPDDMLAFIAAGDLLKSDSAAAYYPRVFVADPLKRGRLRSTPPSGTIAGLYARVDSAQGVWSTPAGRGFTLVDVSGAAYALTDAENGRLTRRAINSIRTFPAHGSIAWGARTLAGDDQQSSEWKYISVRRTALFIEESFYRGLKWAVFEPNAEPLWSQIRLMSETFLHSLFRQGAFQGTTPRESYFVRCGSDTTTQNDVDRGVVNVVVGFAPLTPAEFVVITIRQLTAKDDDP